MMEFVSAFNAAMLGFGPDVLHPDKQTKVMTAAAVYAGIVFARMMFMDAVKQQDTARAARMVAINFRNGIKVGLTQANRVALEKGYGGNA
ncbi:hypothetical protein M2336_001714 [Sphingobium sp. B1D7B]|uniref:hypothetical protein n=1 Tax=Sphingobium sp. B1D7B TaxID=2940578 RepID=UPI00222428DC|nr:hypothetical protein [Sphingobium sp. B1D7B]MCW2405085.1 hypothetical protein [Sphingobium sp. B1D7B]